MIRAGASEFRGAYYSHGKQFIENIPIRRIDFSQADQKKQHDAIAKIVKQLVATKAKINQARIASKKGVLKRKLVFLLNSLVSQVNALYQISDKEMKTVMSEEMPAADE
jgi:predicted Zn-dependent peptidase